MPLPTRAAAYTRTGILQRFLDETAAAVPVRVDNDYAETRLGLKGGDVRAFLQSLRVLGLVDPYGSVTDLGKRTRALGQRPAAIRESLAAAYPELLERWDAEGGMPRQEVEDFFKVEYGLSNSTAGPAAKLFCDLQRQYAVKEAAPTSPAPSRAVEAQPAAPAAAPAAAPTSPPPTAASPIQDVRLAALDAVKSSLRVEINENWDPERIDLVFDRMERLVSLVVGEPRGK